MPIETSVTVPDLGPGAGYALWGFRAAAIGGVRCPTLTEGFEEVFGEFAHPALGALLLLAQQLGSEGGRRINIAGPGCNFATADELSIIAMLAAAQAHDTDRCYAHLTWLMCGRNEKSAFYAADSIAGIFCAVDLTIHAPRVEVTNKANRSFRVLHEVGHA